MRLASPSTMTQNRMVVPDAVFEVDRDPLLDHLLPERDKVIEGLSYRSPASGRGTRERKPPAYSRPSSVSISCSGEAANRFRRPGVAVTGRASASSPALLARRGGRYEAATSKRRSQPRSGIFARACWSEGSQALRAALREIINPRELHLDHCHHCPGQHPTAS